MMLRLVKRTTRSLKTYQKVERMVHYIPKYFDRTLMTPATSNLQTDPLFFPHEEYTESKFHDIIQDIRKNPSFNLNERSMGYLLYNMAHIGSKDEIVLDLIFSQIDKQRGKFRQIYALGGLCGILRMNLGHKYFDIFVEELTNFDEIETGKLIDLLAAMGENTSIDMETKHAYIQEVIEPFLMDVAFKKRIKYINILKLRTIKALYNLDYLHTGSYSKILDSLLSNYPACESIITAYEQLSILEDRGVELENLSTLKEKCMGQIDRKMRDINWVYNIEERRFWTYNEMVQRRELEHDYTTTHFTKLLTPEEHVLYTARLKQIREGDVEEEEDDGIALSDEDILRLSSSGAILAGEQLEDLPDFYEQEDVFDIEDANEDEIQ